MLKKLFIFFNFLVFSLSSFSLNVDGEYIVDKYKNKIKAKEYNRILVTDPGVVEILFEIEADNKIVAIAKTMRSKIHPIEKVEKLENIGNISNMNFEKMVEYKPDLIIINAMMLKNMDRIKSMGYEVIVSAANNLEEILNLIEVVGVISGQKTKAEDLKNRSIEKLNKIKEFSKSKKEIKGAIVFSVSPFLAFTDESLPGDVMKHLGIKNIASGLTGERPILSPEYILKENPNFIAGAMSLESPNQIFEASNVISKTKAGKNNDIFILDSSSILRSTHRIFDEMLILKEKVEKIK